MAFPMTPLLVALVLQRPEWGPPPPVAPFGMKALPAQRTVIPMVFPVVANCRWRDDYGDRRSGFLHTGIDIRAAKMSPIVAPFAGTIGLKRESFWIYGLNGWTMLGTHLNDDDPGRHDHRASRDFMFAPDVAPGGRVMAGQLIGYVGMSGDATGPHLHFELYAPGAGPTMGRIRDPYPSLRFSHRLSAPVPTILTGKPPKGTMRLQGCVRYVDSRRGLLTMILVSKQLPNGRTVRVAHPRYVRLRLPGGCDVAGLESVGETAVVGALVPAAGTVDGARASRLILPTS